MDSNSYTPLLKKQLKRYLKNETPIPPEWVELLDAINRSYEHYERDHLLGKRSLDISSLEMRQLISELAEKEEIFRQFAENSNDVFWMLSSDLNQVLYVSPNLEKLFGFSKDTAPKSFQEWCELIHPDDRQQFIDSWKEVAQSKSFCEIDYRLRAPGNIIWIRDRAFQVKNDQGIVYRIAGIARDVTVFKMSGLRREIRNQVNKLLIECSTLEEMATRLLEVISRALESNLGIFWAVDPDKNEANYLTSWHQDKSLEDFINHCRFRTISQGMGFVGEILSKHETLFSTNIEVMHPQEAPASNMRGVIGFPVCLKEKNYGVFEFFNPSMGEIKERWLQLFNDISKQIGLFIERKLTESALVASEERFRSTVEHATIGIALVSLEGQFLQMNSSFCEMMGFSKEELLEKNLKEIIFREDLPKEITYQAQLLAKETPFFQTEKRFITKNKDTLWTLASTSLVRDVQNDPLYFICEVQDISQRKYTEEKLSHLAYYDLLTSLPNKKLVEDTLNQVLLTASLKNEKIAIFLIKMNRFGWINDIHGSSVADLLLKQIALRLVDRIQIKDIVGRWGEDEFVIVLSQIKTLESASLLAHKILTVLKEPFIIEKRKFFLTASIGIAIFPDHANQTQLLFKNAYMAMYRAMREGADNFKFYTDEMLKESQEKMLFETHLRKAITDHELFLNFQPIIDTETNSIASVEVLLRWHSKALGLIPPAKFIPLAEENGFILEIGEWVLLEGCKALKQLERENFPPVTFSINISALQLKEENFLDRVAQVLKQTELDPHFLRLEIVESQLMENIKESIEKINYLREQHIQIAIDDFGVGYSSFNYLKQFSVDRFKIDASFIRNIHKDPKNAGIFLGILTMSHALGIRSIAEGIETQEEFEFVKKMGCREMQGYYFSHPLSFEELKSFMRQKMPVKVS